MRLPISGPSTLNRVRVLTAGEPASRDGIRCDISARTGNKCPVHLTPDVIYRRSYPDYCRTPPADRMTPDLLDTLRLPCFATFSPQAAATKALAKCHRRRYQRYPQTDSPARERGGISPATQWRRRQFHWDARREFSCSFSAAASCSGLSSLRTTAENN